MDNTEDESKIIVSPNKMIMARPASMLTPRDPEFLWYPYIPKGMITFLEGDPGVGKSWVGMKIASDITNGIQMPGQTHIVEPQNVLMLAGEEDLELAVANRLSKVKADMERVFVTDSKFVLNKKGIDELDFLLGKVEAAVVFLDPIQSYVPREIDTNVLTDVYDMLDPLARMARRHNSAFIIVRHLRKGGSANAKHAGIGSIGLTGIARSVMLVQETKGGNRVMKHVKHSYTERGDSLKFDMGDNGFRWAGTWDDRESDKVETYSKKHEAMVQFLFDTLRDGSKPVIEVYQIATKAGFKPRTLETLKKYAGVESIRIGSAWHWQLRDRAGLASPVVVG